MAPVQQLLCNFGRGRPYFSPKRWGAKSQVSPTATELKHWVEEVILGGMYFNDVLDDEDNDFRWKLVYATLEVLSTSESDHSVHHGVLERVQTSEEVLLSVLKIMK